MNKLNFIKHLEDWIEALNYQKDKCCGENKVWGITINSKIEILTELLKFVKAGQFDKERPNW